MEIYFSRDNGAVDEAIEALIEITGGINHPGIVRDMIIASLKAGKENMVNADLKMMNSTLKEMRYTAKVFEPYRNIKKVTVFGSARTLNGEPTYEMARLFGKKLADAGYMVITGGGGGIMEAANEGAGPDSSFGVNIRLPFEQKANPVLEGSSRVINYKYFFNRKVAFIKEADAVALFPGGFGTLDEAMETLTLLQTGKRYPMPLILLDEEKGDYWANWYDFMDKGLASKGYIDDEDFSFFQMVDSVDKAVDIINQFYSRYHSLRYVGTKLVIRLLSPIGTYMLKEIKTRFKDILIPGGDIYRSEALDQEANEPEIIDLPRLVVDFNQKEFGRLRQLIDAINLC